MDPCPEKNRSLVYVSCTFSQHDFITNTSCSCVSAVFPNIRPFLCSKSVSCGRWFLGDLSQIFLEIFRSVDVFSSIPFKVQQPPGTSHRLGVTLYVISLPLPCSSCLHHLSMHLLSTFVLRRLFLFHNHLEPMRSPRGIPPLFLTVSFIPPSHKELFLWASQAFRVGQIISYISPTQFQPSSGTDHNTKHRSNAFCKSMINIQILTSPGHHT